MNRGCLFRILIIVLVGAAVVAGVGAVGWLYFRTSWKAKPDVALQRGQELLTHRRVLAVVGHPDDLEWYIGGTLHRLVQEGAEVQVVVGSSGEAGPNRIGAEDLAAAREQEQLEAAKVHGYSKVRFLRLPDRRVSEGDGLQKGFLEALTEFQPDAVLTFDPQLPSLPYLHADHQGTGRVVLDHWLQMAEPRPGLYLFQSRRPNAAVDISSVIDKKVEALSKHLSQGLGMRADRVKSFNRNMDVLGVEHAETFRIP